LLRTYAIPSVLRQTYPAWELLVIGHPSDEGSAAEIVASMHDDRVRYEPYLDDQQQPVVSLPDDPAGWMAAALGHAERYARGSLIAPIADEDEFLPDHLGDCVTALSARDVDLAYGTVLVRHRGTGTERIERNPWVNPATRTRFDRGGDVMYASSVCYRAEASGSVTGPAGLEGPSARWRAMRAAGARFASLDAPQAIVVDRGPGAWIPISMPSLPSVERFNERVAEIFSVRRTSNSGPNCAQLEGSVADYLGVEHVVGTPSGDVALEMAMHAVRERRPGRRDVIVPSYTFPSTVDAVVRAGLRPRLCDVDPTSLIVTADTVAPLLSSRTAAIVPVHAHGHPCDMGHLETLAREHGAMLVSDAAAAFGSELDGRKIGGFGDLEVFSLSSTKVLTAGEGGLLSCRDGALASLLRRIGRYGLGDDYRAEVVGINGRLAELPAALALAGLPNLDGWLRRRRVSAARYQELLADCDGVRIAAPIRSGATSTWKDVPLILDTPQLANLIATRLSRYRVETRPYYRPLHRMAPFAPFADSPLAVSDALEGRVLCIPIFNDIHADAVALVADVVHETVSAASWRGVSTSRGR
jgi:dTDP-4-amino-4,6-dideoxygalactose transaminase